MNGAYGCLRIRSIAAAASTDADRTKWWTAQ